MGTFLLSDRVIYCTSLFLTASRTLYGEPFYPRIGNCYLIYTLFCNFWISYFLDFLFLRDSELYFYMLIGSWVTYGLISYCYSVNVVLWVGSVYTVVMCFVWLLVILYKNRKLEGNMKYDVGWK